MSQKPKSTNQDKSDKSEQPPKRPPIAGAPVQVMQFSRDSEGDHCKEYGPPIDQSAEEKN